MRTKTISAQPQLFRSYHYSTRNTIPFAWPLLRSSFPKLTSSHQFPAIPPPTNSVFSSPPGSLQAMADVPLPNIKPSPRIDPRTRQDHPSATEPSSLNPEIPSYQPQNPDIPMPSPPTHDPGQTPPGVDPPITPPEVTPPPKIDPPPRVDPSPNIPMPTPSPDFPSPPIPSPSIPEIPSEPRNPEIPIPPPQDEPGWNRPDFGLPRAPPEVTPPSPPEIIPPQIF